MLFIRETRLICLRRIPLFLTLYALAAILLCYSATAADGAEVQDGPLLGAMGLDRDAPGNEWMAGTAESPSFQALGNLPGIGKSAGTYYSDVQPPPTVRIARREKCADTGGDTYTIGGSTYNTCKASYPSYYPDACGRVVSVDEIPLSDYTKRVVGHEWLTSWHPEALKAGAMAAKTYIWYWVNQGGKYKATRTTNDVCGDPTVDMNGNPVVADLDDSVNSQMYIPDREPAASVVAAVDAVSQFRMTKNGKIFQASYRAGSCGTEPDGWKLSQWGSQCWAKDGKSWDWILRHYYWGVEVNGSSRANVDNKDSGFDRTNTSSANWISRPSGGYNSTYWASWNTQNDPTRVGTWRTPLSCLGRWKVSAFIPYWYSTTHAARYTITHAGGQSSVVVDQAENRGKWKVLGTYRFSDSPGARVDLPSNTGETVKTTQIAFDAIRFDRVSCETKVTMGMSPQRVTYGYSGHDSSKVSAFLMSGSLPLSDRWVNIFKKPYGDTAWTKIGAYKTSSWGKATITDKPDRHTLYKAVAGGDGAYWGGEGTGYTLNHMSVPIKISSSQISPGDSVALSGSVNPSHPSLEVYLEKKTGASWTRLVTKKTTGSSQYSFSWKPPSAGSYSLRVCTTWHWDHSPGCSGTRVVTVGSGGGGDQVGPLAKEVIVDDKDSGFVRANTSSPNWASRGSGGYESSYWRSWNTQDTPTRSATWKTELSCSGKWKVIAFIPYWWSTSKNATYTIYRAGGSSVVHLNQSTNRGEWANLGTYRFNKSPGAKVYLPSNTGETVRTTNLAYDAIKFVRQNCDPKITLDVIPQRLVYGWSGHDSTLLKVTLLDGVTPKSGRAIQFEKKPYGAEKWKAIKTVNTDANGKAQVRDTPKNHTLYRAKVGPHGIYGSGQANNYALVHFNVPAVLARKTIGLGQQAQMWGTIFPLHSGLKVEMMRKTSTGWAVVASSNTDASSVYNLYWKPSSKGEYRLKVCTSWHWDHSPNCSASRYLTVE